MKFNEYIKSLYENKNINEAKEDDKYDSKKSYKGWPESRIEVINRLDSVYGDKWRTGKEFDGLRNAFKSSVRNANDTMNEIGFNNKNDTTWEQIFIYTLAGTTTGYDYGPNTTGMLNKIGVVG